MRTLLMATGIALTAASPALWAATADGPEDAPIVLPAPSQPVPRVQADPVDPMAATIEVPRRWLKPWTVDLRFLLGSAAPISDLDGAGIDTSINAGSSGSFRSLALFGYRPDGGPWGWLVGGGLASGGHGGDFQGDEDALSYGFLAFELTGGLLYVPTPGLQFELKPFLRLGGGALDADALGGLDVDEVEAGGYVAGGMSAGMWYAWPSGFQIGGEFGLEGWAGKSEIDGQDFELSGGGGFAAIGTGIRW